MNPLEFMQIALRLSAGDEAGKRTAVSRAYYCVFHVALELLASCGIRFSKGIPPHDLVSRCLQNSGDQQIQYAGNMLKELRTARNAADYDLATRRFSLQQPVNLQLRTAQDILTRLPPMLPDAIVATLREYARAVLKITVTD
jgi:uncharacterized protein (UPF0332 family)